MGLRQCEHASLSTRWSLAVAPANRAQPPVAITYPALSGTGGNFANATSQYFSGIIGRALQLSVDYRFY